jgi:3-deoxy-D-manno-octulosonic-acid transferase
MINGYDFAWGSLLTLGAPFWVLHPRLRTKVRRALSERMGRGVSRMGSAPAVMIHAVSLGEINATRALVRMLSEARPGLRFVVSTTTDTGYARGRELYGADPKVTLIRFPLDFSGAIARVLDNLRPSLVVLMELEVWPNFMKHCESRAIPVVLANARLTPSSFKHYRWGGPVIRKMFRRIEIVCAQAVSTLDHTPAPTPASSAAPNAAPSVVLTVTRFASSVSARICRHSKLLAPPPETRTSSIDPSPASRIRQNMSLIPNATPSSIDRVKCGWPCRIVNPTHAPRASGSG